MLPSLPSIWEGEGLENRNNILTSSSNTTDIAAASTPTSSGTPPSPAVAALPYEGMLRVQGYDIDLAGIVHNTVFVRWLEDLRTGWCDVYLPLPQQIAEGYCPIVTSTEIEYKNPIRFGDAVTGKLWMTAKRVRWVADIELWNGDRLAARARQTGAFVGVATLKPLPIPARLVAALAQAADSSTAAK